MNLEFTSSIHKNGNVLFNIHGPRGMLTGPQPAGIPGMPDVSAAGDISPLFLQIVSFHWPCLWRRFLGRVSSDSFSCMRAYSPGSFVDL